MNTGYDSGLWSFSKEELVFEFDATKSELATNNILINDTYMNLTCCVQDLI